MVVAIVLMAKQCRSALPPCRSRPLPISYKVANAFVGNDAVYGLSLMNEPHDLNGMWKKIAQAGLDAIRRTDRERLVLAPGDQWSGAWSWWRYNMDFLLDGTETGSKKIPDTL